MVSFSSALNSKKIRRPGSQHINGCSPALFYSLPILSNISRMAVSSISPRSDMALISKALATRAFHSAVLIFLRRFCIFSLPYTVSYSLRSG